MECSICCETSADYITHCGHAFHNSCITEWASISNTCPLCREMLIDMQSPEFLLILFLLIGNNG
jgi:hypothetical protein